MNTANEIDRPYGPLELDNRRVQYRGNHLELIAGEIRFVASSDRVSPADALAFRESLEERGHSFDHLEPAERQHVEISASGTEASAGISVERGWELRRSSNQLKILLFPQLVIVQTSAYERWSTSFKPLVRALAESVADVLDPDLLQRVGLRYVNRITNDSAHSPHDWKGLIDEALLGAIAHASLGAHVAGSQQQVDFQFEGSAGATLRHGAFRDGAADGRTSYLIDIDVFVQRSSRFTPSEMEVTAQRLNRTAMALFGMCLTDSLEESMDPIQLADPKEGE